MTASLNEKLSHVKWGEFKFGDLFDIKGIKQAKSQKLIPSADNGIPYVVQSQENNMVSRYVDRQYLLDNDEPVCQGNAIVLGVTLPAVSYQKNEFGASQVITARASFLTPNIGNFIASVLSKYITVFSYQNKPGIQIYKNMYIALPQNTNDEVDFGFMESFTSELESERIAELSAYLKVNGLDNYELSKEEKKALELYETLSFESFKLTSVFDVKNTSNLLSKQIAENSGKTPYLCASAENNGVSSYIDYDKRYLEKGHCIFIGGKTFAVSYQQEDFFSNDSHNLALYLREYSADKSEFLYLATCLRKSLSHKYTWGDSVSKTKITTDKISLPAKDGKPDYQSMNLLISAIQKMAIKDVVRYVNQH